MYCSPHLIWAKWVLPYSREKAWAKIWKQFFKRSKLYLHYFVILETPPARPPNSPPTCPPYQPNANRLAENFCWKIRLKIQFIYPIIFHIVWLKLTLKSLRKRWKCEKLTTCSKINAWDKSGSKLGERWELNGWNAQMLKHTVSIVECWKWL